MSKRLNKSGMQRLHFKKRVEERFGISVNRHDCREIINLIRLGKTKPVQRKSNRVCVHQLEWKGETMNVVYDNLRGQIVTALFPEPPETTRGEKK